MKKTAFILVGLLGALLVTVGFNSAAQAYPEVRIGMTVDRQVLFGGDTFTATATANVTCSWDLGWNGTDRTSTGTKVITTFTAPQVTKQVTIDLSGTCTYDATEGGSARTVAGTTTWRHRIPITVMPAASGAAAAPSGAADLPNSGGPDQMVLLGGLALLLTGAAAVTVARRRADRAELWADAV